MDNAQFSEYVEKLQGRTYRVAYSYVRNFADAEEITQDAFLKLYCSDKSFRTEDDAAAWLIRITINLSINLLRSGWKRNRGELPENELVGELPKDRELSADLKEMLHRLTPEQMTAVYLHYYEGYTVKETAKMCGTTSASVTMRLARARARLKTMLTTEGENYE